MPDRRSRLKARLDAGGQPDLPEIDQEIEFLVAYLFDAGPMSAGGQSQSPLTWADLQAWERGSGITLHPWQARLLRALSAEYLSESLTADAHDAPPPWVREADREKIAKHIRRVIRG